jgi:hypothetical protein
MPTFGERASQVAGDLADQAKRGVEYGQARYDQLRRKRELDALARQLGWVVHRGRMSGTPDDIEVARLSGLIATREAEYNEYEVRTESQRPNWTR